MISVKRIREELDTIKNALAKRGISDFSNLMSIIDLDDQRKKAQFQQDELLNLQKQKAAEIGKLFSSGNAEAGNAMKAEVTELKERTKGFETTLKDVTAQLNDLLIHVPNIPHASVPAGSSEEDNEVFQEWSGELPVLSGEPKAHWDLAKIYDIIDMEAGVKITGAGFPVFKGKGAQLQRALINFFLNKASEAGYLEIVPPFLVNAASALGTGQIPDKEGQMYHVTEDELFLIPTSEVPITNLYRDTILKAEDLPIRLTGYSPCFRREAGSYGKEVRGLNRVHQFDKVELVQIQHPDKSHDTLMEMVNHVKHLLEELELPYRILKLCGGDLGGASALTYDFETWSAAQERWLEVSSVSNFETFQARRLNLRFKGDDSKNQFAHTLNGSALALARIIATILENNQTENGIKIPTALKPYLNFELID